MTNINLNTLSGLLQKTTNISAQNKQGNKDVDNDDFSKLLQSFSKETNTNEPDLNISSNNSLNFGSISSSFPNSFLDKQINSLNNMYIKADKSQAEVAAGYGDPLQATMDVNRADLNFKLMMEIRNKVIGAFKEITRIQV